MRSDNALIQHKSRAKRNIKFRSLELIGPKVRTSHSGEGWEKNKTSIKKKKKKILEKGSPVDMPVAFYTHQKKQNMKIDFDCYLLFLHYKQ